MDVCIATYTTYGSHTSLFHVLARGSLLLCTSITYIHTYRRDLHRDNEIFLDLVDVIRFHSCNFSVWLDCVF